MSCSSIRKSLTRVLTNGLAASSIITRMVASAQLRRIHQSEDRDMESARYTAGSCKSAEVPSSPPTARKNV